MTRKIHAGYSDCQKMNLRGKPGLMQSHLLERLQILEYVNDIGKKMLSLKKLQEGLNAFPPSILFQPCQQESFRLGKKRLNMLIKFILIQMTLSSPLKIFLLRKNSVKSMTTCYISVVLKK